MSTAESKSAVPAGVNGAGGPSLPSPLRVLAAGQGGVFTSGQARGFGLTRQDLARLANGGAIHRLRPGEFAVRETWQVAEPWTRLLLRTKAALLHRPDAVASHHAALAIHGLPLYGVDLEKVDLSASVKRPFRRSGVVTHVREAGVVPIDVDGLLAVPVARAVVQTALASGLVAGLVAADGALHRGLTTIAEISAAAPPAERVRGCQRIRELVRLADGLAESPGETRLRLILQILGVRVRSQMEVRRRGGRVVARVDFLVGDRVVVEFDGLVKYEGADGRRALAAEKEREDLLRALGFVVIRVVWAELDRPDLILARVRAALRSIAA